MKGGDVMELSANALQLVEPGQNVTFTASPVPCNMGFVIWRPDSGIVTLRGIVPYSPCRCHTNGFAQYYASLSANIEVPEGGTAEAISLALALNGEPIPTSSMIYTPAAIEQFGNISTQIYIPIPRGCCQSIAVENTSTQTIGIQNCNLTIIRPDMYAIR